MGYVHAIGHTLSGLYDTPHGLAMAILLPHVLRAYGPKAHKRLAELCDICRLAEKADTIREEDVDQIVAWAEKEGNPLYPTPVTWNKKDFKKFILSLLQERDQVRSV